MSELVSFTVDPNTVVTPPRLIELLQAHYGDENRVALVRERVAALDDTRVIDLYAENENAAEEMVAPHIFARNVLQDDVRRRFTERRAPDDTSPKEIPHPRIEVRSEFRFGAYRVDAVAVEKALRDAQQPHDVIAKLLVIDEAREEYDLPLTRDQIMALQDAIADSVRDGLDGRARLLGQLLRRHDVPRTVAIRNMTSFLAFVRKIAGSDLGIALASLLDRPCEGERTTFKPRPQTPPARNVSPEAQA